MSSELTNQDADLLSAYLDNALDADERAVLEARLTQEEFLRRELEALRRTIELVNTLPTLKAPRNFTLTPAILAPRPEALPAVLAQPAVFAAAPKAAPTQPRVLPRPRPRRMLWQPFAAAAAVVVLAFGFFSVATFNAGMPASAPNEIAQVNTATLPFSNMVVATGADSSVPANAVGEAQDMETTTALSTAAKVGTAAAEIQPVAPNAPAQLTVVAQHIPTTQDAQQMLTQSQFSQGGMGGGGDDSQLNDAPVFSANESINSDLNLHGFTVATVMPMQEIMGQTTAQSAVLAPAATPAPADLMIAPPTLLDEQADAATNMLPAATGGITTLVYEPPVIEAEQSQWLRVILALLNPFIGRFLPLP